MVGWTNLSGLSDNTGNGFSENPIRQIFLMPSTDKDLIGVLRGDYFAIYRGSENEALIFSPLTENPGTQHSLQTMCAFD
jgi:hypothetical protein